MGSTRVWVAATMIVAALVTGTQRASHASEAADLPGLMESAEVLDESAAHVEFGAAFFYNNDFRAFNVPLLGRVRALPDRLEVRFGFDSVLQYVDSPGNEVTAVFANPFVGVKGLLTESDDLLLTLRGDVAFPVGPDGVRLDSLEVRTLLGIGAPIGVQVSFLANIGLTIADNSSLLLGAGIGLTPSDVVSVGIAFVTIAGLEDFDTDNFTSYLDLTLGLALAEALQLDVALTKSLEDTESVTIYVGVTLRFG